GIEAGKSYCSRRFGGATCDDKSAQIYARFDKNDWRIQPAEFYRFHDAEVNSLGYLMSRKIILIKQELLLLVYELNRSGLLAENEKIRPILAQLEKLLLCDLSPSTNDSVKN